MATQNTPNTSFNVVYIMNDPNAEITLTINFDNIKTATSDVRINRTKIGAANFENSFSIVLRLPKDADSKTLARDLDGKTLKLDITSVGDTDNEHESTAEIKLSGGKKDKILPGEGLPKQVNFYIVRVDFILI